MKIFICVAALSLAFTILCSGQSKENPTKPYLTSGGELILSLASVEQDGHHEKSIVRFSPVFNFQVMVNKDMNETFGLFTGLAIRNVGYIMTDYIDTGNLSYK